MNDEVGVRLEIMQILQIHIQTTSENKSCWSGYTTTGSKTLNEYIGDWSKWRCLLHDDVGDLKITQ